MDKDDYEALFYRGCAYVKKEEYDKAIADLEEAVWIKPDHAGGYAEKTLEKIRELANG